MSELEIDSVSVNFGGVRALRDISMSFTRGKVSSIVGPNGAGKSTALDVLTGLRVPNAGRARLDGRTLDTRKGHQAACAGIRRTFQTPRLLEDRSVFENIVLGLAASKNLAFGRAFKSSTRSLWRRLRELPEVESVLSTLGLEGHIGTVASAAPYGIRRLTEIARALVAKPSFLVLDEPAAGMNSVETAKLGRVIADIALSGAGVVLVEHDLALVTAISSDMYVLDAGSLIGHGRPADIMNDPAVIKAYTGIGNEA